MRLSSARLQAVEQSIRTSRRNQSISFIGLGRMGYEMAFNLFSKKHAETQDSRFVICDAVPSVSQKFHNEFGRRFGFDRIHVVSTPEQAVHASQTVLTMLPSSPHVRTVYSETNGILDGLRSLTSSEAQTTLCIDSTTLDVDIARDTSSRLHALGAEMVDAPVSGGVAGAKAGSLSFLVGGTKAEYFRSFPILTYMGQRVIHCGESGSGLAAKICNNLILGVQQIVVAEAMLLGQKLGLDASVLAGVINSSTGACWSSSVNNPVPSAVPEKSPPCERDYDGGFATSLMLKDMGLALESAESKSSPVPLGLAAKKFYELAIQAQPELAQKDFSSVYKFLMQNSSTGNIDE